MRRILTALLLLISSVPLFAQLGGAPNITKETELSVRVVYENGRSTGPNMRVELLGAYGGSVNINTTDTSGMVTFHKLDPARYKLRVSGPNIITTTSPDIDMTDSGPRVNYTVTVKATSTAEAPTGTIDANIPKDAQKEFNKGNDSMQSQDWPGAQAHFEKAVTIYPKYAMAYNDLGMVYLRSNQGEKGIAAFRKAVELDKTLPQANLYLGQFYYDNHDFKSAEPYLLRAANSDSKNPQILLALANTQLKNGEADLALANAQKVHTSTPDHKKYAVAHLIAGQILADKGNKPQAQEEYRLFLKEDPNSQLAPRVKDALAQLDAPAK